MKSESNKEKDYSQDFQPHSQHRDIRHGSWADCYCCGLILSVIMRQTIPPWAGVWVQGQRLHCQHNWAGAIIGVLVFEVDPAAAAAESRGRLEVTPQESYLWLSPWLPTDSGFRSEWKTHLQAGLKCYVGGSVFTFVCLWIRPDQSLWRGWGIA